MNFRYLVPAMLAAVASVAAFAGESAPATNATVAAAPQAQASAPQVASSEEDAAAAESKKMICKREATMGTLIPARVCKTAGQWQAERDAARKMVGDMQQRTGSTYGGSK